MSHVTCLRSLILFLSVAVATFGLDKSTSLVAGQEPSPDEALLRAAVSRYFDFFAKRDLDDLLKQWSARAPDLEARRKELQQAFAANDHVEVRNLTIRKLSLEGDKASAQVAVEITASDVKTNRPSTAFGQTNRAMDFVKESGAWKISHDASAEEDLAASLAAAPNATRESIIEHNPELRSPALTRALIAQGNRLRTQGKFTEALDLFQLARAEAERAGDRAGVAATFRSVGTTKRMQGDYTAALDNYRQSLAIDEASGNKPGIAAALNSLANTEYLEGEFVKALEVYERSLALNVELRNTEGISNVLNNLGVIYSDQGNYLKSLESFQKSLALTAASDKLGIASTLLNIGDLYRALGNYPLAIEYLRKALAQAEELHAKPVIWKAWESIGMAQRDRGDYAQALDSLQQALVILNSLRSKDRISSILNEIGVVYYGQRDYAHAFEFFRKSLETEQEIGVKNPATFDNLARVYEAFGNHGKALEFAELAGNTARASDQNEALWQARTTAGQIYLSLNQRDKARQAFAEAIRTIDALRNEVPGGESEVEEYFESRVAPYSAMIGLFVAENNAAAAFDYAERAKGRVILEVLRSGRVKPNKAMTAPERQQERDLTGALVALNTQIAREKIRDKPDAARLSNLSARLGQARLDREEFQMGLYAAHPELKTQRGEAEVLGVDHARELLRDEKSALLEYAVTDNQVYLFVLTKGAADSPVDLRALTLPIKRSDLAARVEKFRQRLANHDLDYGESASDLHNLLIKPAAEQLRNKTTLVIVPDDVLWDLPFQALQPAPNRYLIEDYAISYAPSLTVLNEMIAKRRQRQDNDQMVLLGIGNPWLGNQRVAGPGKVPMTEQLRPLPEAERQVKILGQLYGPGRSKIYIGAEAREERVKREAGRYRILQLATHAILNNANPMYSDVVLSQPAGDSTEDGLLEAWEIMNLDLDADLVVLSACDTARGRIGAGEGVIGLTWAFFVAGSPTTIVSQWSVESASTTELMLNFHRNLRTVDGARNGMTKAEALRQAQLKLLRTSRYRHPFFWAGFVVVGDAR
jgi:CHAT domain-containing protein